MDKILLILIAISTLFIVYGLLNIISKRKNKVAMKGSVFETGSNRETVTKKRTVLQTIFSPQAVCNEIQVYDEKYSRRSYFQSFIKGLIIGLFVMYVLYRNIPLSLVMAVGLGFVFPYLDLNKAKVQYEIKVKDQISHYFKLFSTYMRSNGYNLSKSLEQCIERLEQPIQTDLEKVLFELKQGTNAEAAFNNFNRKYDFQGVRLFHHKAFLIAEMGQDEFGSLKEMANRFAEKKYWREDFHISMKSRVRERKGILALSLVIYLIVMFLTSYYYSLFANSLTGKVSITVGLIWYLIILLSQRKLAGLDPTEFATDK